VTINGGYPEDLIGKNVRFRDLVSRSDLNGERGTILDWLDSRQRYNVKVDNGEVGGSANLAWLACTGSSFTFRFAGDCC